MLWIVTAASFLLSLAGTAGALKYLRARAILDRPNDRSSHAVPTPRGGGLAVTPVVLGGWVILDPAPSSWLLASAGLALAGLSWIDDQRGLSPAIRLPAQVVAVAFVIAGGGLPDPVFGGLLPGWADTVAAAVLWVWFVNLFNFMDGSDGITGVETIVIGFGVATVGGLADAPLAIGPLGLVAASALAAFLVWNWHPARLFLGDVGSIPVGFALGWLLLSLAGRGYWAPALILPLYHLADATLTLVRRGLRGEKVWRPHREHFYQQAIRRGLGHRAVAGGVLACGAVLVAAAAWAVVAAPWLPLTLAAVDVAVLCAYFSGHLGRHA